MSRVTFLWGKRADLDSQPKQDGTIYFCVDDKTMHIDFLDDSGVVQRLQINADDAKTISGKTFSDLTSTFIPYTARGIVNGVAPLNENLKINSQYLPAYTELNVTPNDQIADISAKQTWSSEQTYNYEDYGLVLEDTINGVACGFKAPRGLFNQLFVQDIVFTREDNTANSSMADEIGFYIFDGVETKVAVRDSKGNVTTAGYNNLLNYKKVAAITNHGSIILKSSTPGSSKYFDISVDDSGAISAVQV